MKNRSPLTLAILAGEAKEKADEKKPTAKPEAKDDDTDLGLESAAEEIIAAVSKKDSKALVEALRSFHEQCG